MKSEVLRKSILQMAIQGKLVPQNSADEPASVLLQKIRAEKEKLIKEGKIKRDKTDSVIFKGEDGKFYEKTVKDVKDITDQLPFEIPDSWELIRLATLCWLADLPKTSGEKLPYLDAKTLRGNSNKNFLFDGKVVDIGTKVILVDGENSGEVFNIPFRGYMGSTFKKLEIISQCDIDFLNIVLNFYRDTFRGNKIGAAIPHLNKELFRSLIIGLPPLEEQKRIVEAIEKFEPLLAEYDKLEQQAEKLDGEIFDKLKKSILQYAIQGKLVPQDSSDEPASVLLSKIKAEKEKLIKEGKIKKEKPLPPITDSEKPFDIPDSWQWVRLREVVYNRGQITPKNKFAYIDIGSINNVQQKLNDVENIIDAHEAPSRARKIVQLGDVLYSTVRPYLHNMCVVDKEFSFMPIASTGFAVLTCLDGFNNKFLFYYMLSPKFDEYSNSSENARGVAYPAINDDKLYRALIPLPPLNEQKRIVARIEEIFTYINIKITS